MQQFMVHDFMQKTLLFHAFKDQVETKYIDFQCVPKIILYIHKKIKKLTKFSEDTYFVVISLYKKFHVENHMRLSFQPQIQPDTTHLSETSSEILGIVSTIRSQVSETL